MLEREITVTPEGGQPFNFKASELVTFPAGMNLRWEVHKEVRNQFRFGD